MSVPIKPIADYVVAVADKPETKTAGGILLPETAREVPKTSKIVAVGKDVKDIKVGDRIIFGGYTMTEVKIGDEDYQIIKAENIYATVK